MQTPIVKVQFANDTYLLRTTHHIILHNIIFYPIEAPGTVIATTNNTASSALEALRRDDPQHRLRREVRSRGRTCMRCANCTFPSCVFNKSTNIVQHGSKTNEHEHEFCLVNFLRNRWTFVNSDELVSTGNQRFWICSSWTCHLPTPWNMDYFLQNCTICWVSKCTFKIECILDDDLFLVQFPLHIEENRGDEWRDMFLHRGSDSKFYLRP